MDVFALQWADNPQISPDGKRIVYQRMGFDIMKDRKRSSLWTIDADGRNQRPLAAVGFDPVWSPDGKRLAFVAKGEGSAQIQMHWMDSGQTARISELTQSPGNLSWSPDGQWLAFTMRVPAEDTPMAAMPKAPKGAEWAAPVKVIDRVIYRIDGGGYVDPGLHPCVRGLGRGWRGAPDHQRQAQLQWSAGMDGRWQGADRFGQPRRRLGIPAARQRAVPRGDQRRRDDAPDRAQGPRQRPDLLVRWQAAGLARLRRQAPSLPAESRLCRQRQRRQRTLADRRHRPQHPGDRLGWQPRPLAAVRRPWAHQARLDFGQRRQDRNGRRRPRRYRDRPALHLGQLLRGGRPRRLHARRAEEPGQPGRGRTLGSVHAC